MGPGMLDGVGTVIVGFIAALAVVAFAAGLIAHWIF